MVNEFKPIGNVFYWNTLDWIYLEKGQHAIFITLFKQYRHSLYLCFTRKYLIDGLDPPKALYIFKKNKKQNPYRVVY